GQALKMTASNNTPECRLDVSSSGRRFELRVAALGCIASHAAHRLSSSKMELRSYQWKNPQTQLLIEAPPFLCTRRFCGERVAKKRKGIERRHASADIKANEGTNVSIKPSWCEVPPGTLERLQFFTGAPQFFRMKRLSARLVYSVTNSQIGSGDDNTAHVFIFIIRDFC